jgi:hypothetical protein
MNVAELSERLDHLMVEIFNLKKIVDADINLPAELTDAARRVNESAKALQDALPEM